MAIRERFKTDYPGVFYIIGQSLVTNKEEKIYYIRFRKDGKETEEKAGRQFQDNMTPAKANTLRAEKIKGAKLTNQGKRDEVEAQKEADESRWTVARLWDEYKSGKPENKAIKTDSGRFDNYLKDSLGDKEPKDIIPLDVDRLRLNLLKTKSPQTVLHVLGILKRISRFALKKMLCPPIPFIIEMPDVDNQKTEDLSPTELHCLLEAIAKDENKQVGNMMLMALYTGMRRGELFKLTWGDVDFERGFILIRDPKGGKSQSIPLNDAARELLDNQEQTASKYVFPGKGGKQLVDIKKSANRIKKAAGLPDDFRPLHGLRHTYASMLASSGKVDIYTLQKLMTHKTPVMTQRYDHLRDDALRQAADLASDIISDAMNQSRQKTVSITRKAHKG